ncbi:MAG: nucleotidyltransferase domain-containing protein [Bacteroidales bacterium]|nr:nucleotidyltransferase domain-containing protein [Bacteroidales bacterium]MDY2934835.1 nucleotidyltransferase domain-containing protein [Candidatus Cryptobacteroides sp.]
MQAGRCQCNRPAKVYLFGSYSKGCARPDIDIDIAVIVLRVNGDYLSTAASLWRITMDENTLIEPVLIEEVHPSPLYEDILQTGIAV